MFFINAISRGNENEAVQDQKGGNQENVGPEEYSPAAPNFDLTRMLLSEMEEGGNITKGKPQESNEYSARGSRGQ